jgi:putative toxin-antitoxin system antitoxin component (TIGR02293 family)
MVAGRYRKLAGLPIFLAGSPRKEDVVTPATATRPAPRRWLAELLPATLSAAALREPTPELIDRIRRGLPTTIIDHLIAAEILLSAEVDRLILPRRTLADRKAARRPLTPAESDRLARLLRVLLCAEDSFQNPDKAHQWLRRPNRALGDRVPLELLDTDAGAEAVTAILTRIAAGVYS